MTKKDYELIAGSFSRTQPSKENLPDHHSEWRVQIFNLSSVLARENPLFNRDKFIKACGIED